MPNLLVSIRHYVEGLSDVEVITHPSPFVHVLEVLIDTLVKSTILLCSPGLLPVTFADVLLKLD